MMAKVVKKQIFIILSGIHPPDMHALFLPEYILIQFSLTYILSIKMTQKTIISAYFLVDVKKFVNEQVNSFEFEGVHLVDKYGNI